jgi:hypothetical protein
VCFGKEPRTSPHATVHPFFKICGIRGQLDFEHHARGRASPIHYPDISLWKAVRVCTWAGCANRIWHTVRQPSSSSISNQLRSRQRHSQTSPPAPLRKCPCPGFEIWVIRNLPGANTTTASPRPKRSYYYSQMTAMLSERAVPSTVITGIDIQPDWNSFAISWSVSSRPGAFGRGCVMCVNSPQDLFG